jgi:hypothetical protein
VVDALSARVEIKKEKDYQILLDNQCQIHIFANDLLLSNIHRTDHLMTVCGEVEGSNFKTDMVGNRLDFEDDVYGKFIIVFISVEALSNYMGSG